MQNVEERTVTEYGHGRHGVGIATARLVFKHAGSLWIVALGAALLYTLKAMDYRTHIVVLLMLLTAGIYAWGVGGDFSRYSLILDRRPFAAVALSDDSAAAVVTLVAPPAFVKDLRMCAITESPAGVRVGFVNIRSRPPQPYYLYVGDSEDGIELVEADYDKEGALVRKGSEQYWLHMGGESLGGAGASRSSAPVGAAAPARPVTPRVSGVSKAANKADASSVSYAERRRRRLEEMRARAADKRAISEVEAKQRLRDYQMDLIRKGLTPLPMQLTPEMDAQLVAEGVLPPVE